MEQNHEVSYDQVQQRELFNSLISPQPTVIAIEGGPCGGKTTLLNELDKLTKEQQRPLITIPEVATPLILDLIKQGTNFLEVAEDPDKFIEFETLILKTIIESVNQAKTDHAGTDAIIVIDRADIKSYLFDEYYRQVLANLKLSQPPIIDLVDRVIYLPTVAKKSADIYEKLMATNPSRYENVVEAIATCHQNLEAASLNQKLSIYSDSDFKTKIDRAVSSVLGSEVQPVSKFSIDGSDDILHIFETLDQLTQKYLNTTNSLKTFHKIDGQEFQLRKCEIEEQYDSYELIINPGIEDSSYELSRSLTKDHYELLYSSQLLGRIHKYRQRFLFEFEDRGYILSLDYYDELQRCVIEIDGMDSDTASRVNIKGFKSSGYWN